MTLYTHFVDFENAFDSVYHEGILSKLIRMVKNDF